MPKRKDISDPNTRADIYCSLCGVIINHFSFATWSSNLMDILEESELQIYRQKGQTPDHILAPSSKIENASFSKFPWLANSYIRAVTLDPSSDPKNLKCHLTGIFPMDDRYFLYAPRNKDIARICGQPKVSQVDDSQFTSFCATRMRGAIEPTPQTDERIGYLFHAHCWEVLCHIQGKELVEKSLPDLLRASKKFWNEDSMLSTCKWRPRGRWGLFDHDLDFWIRINDKVIHAKYDWYVWGCDIYISPWIVPEVQDAIDSNRAQKKDSKKQKFSRLPYECWLQILELLCPLQYTQLDVQNLRGSLFVSGLDAPNSFWTRRLQVHGDILLELDNLENDDSLDWQSLCLDLMDLLSNKSCFISSGLATRKFALVTIRGILANFTAMLSD